MPPNEFALTQHMLQELYANEIHWLTGWLRGRLRCPHDAEDLAQDTFIRLIRSNETVATIREPRRYLVTVARGLTIDLFRRRSLERQYLETLATKPLQEWPSEESRAVIMEALVELDAMFEGLGETVKQVFILSRFEGLKYSEIAEQLDISVRTVNYCIAKAMEHCCLFRLKNEL